MLREVAKDLFCAEAPLHFFGIPLNARMTVVRLRGGALLVHSPVEPTEALLAELATLGTVRFVVGPNRYHHLFLRPFREAFPTARLYGAPGLPEKRRNLAFDDTLGERPPDEWGGEIDQTLVDGLPFLNEVAFLHRASRTLVLTDLCMHHPNAARERALLRLYLTLEGTAGKIAVPRILRALIRDRRALRRSADRILAWDFERVVLAHGEILEHDARANLERALGAAT